MKTIITSGKGGWVMQIQGDGEFSVFRADEAARLVKTLCKRTLNIDLDTILRLRQEEINAARAVVDSKATVELIDEASPEQ